MFWQIVANVIRSDQFRLVYWIIAFATATHTAWGAATTMQGEQPPQPIQAIGWWALGIAFAFAIDYSMVMIATKLRSGGNRNNKRYIFAFILVAILSAYFQLLYAWAHSNALPFGNGVATDWVARLQSLIDARIIIAPLALPGIATLYTLAGLGKGGEIAGRRNPPQSLRNEGDPQIAVSVERLPQPSQPKLLPGATQLRSEDGSLQGYICPACKKELSISGWSRHKATCKPYIAMTVQVNGHDNYVQ